MWKVSRSFRMIQRSQSMPMGHMVEAALDMSSKGHSLEDIIAHVDRIRDNTYAYLIVDDLNNLVRGGRLTNGAALIAGLFKNQTNFDFL